MLLMLLALARAYRRSAKRWSVSFSLSLYICWSYRVNFSHVLWSALEARYSQHNPWVFFFCFLIGTTCQSDPLLHFKFPVWWDIVGQKTTAADFVWNICKGKASDCWGKGSKLSSKFHDQTRRRLHCNVWIVDEANFASMFGYLFCFKINRRGLKFWSTLNTWRYLSWVLLMSD